MRVEEDFISSEYRFKDDNCSPKHDVKISLNKQLDSIKDGGEETFWITVWGEWGDKKVSQLDLIFENKVECVKCLRDMIAVLKLDYKKK